MSDSFPVPPRVSEGSQSPVPDLNAWRREWLRAQFS